MIKKDYKTYGWTEGLKTAEENIDLYKESEEKEWEGNKFIKANKKIIDLVEEFIHITHRNTLCLSLLGRDDADRENSPVQYATLLFLFIQLRYDRISEEQLQMMIHSSEDLGHAMLLKNVIAYGLQPAEEEYD